MGWATKPNLILKTKKQSKALPRLEGKRDDTGISGTGWGFEKREGGLKTVHCSSFFSKSHPVWVLKSPPWQPLLGDSCNLGTMWERHITTLLPRSHLHLLWALCPERIDQASERKEPCCWAEWSDNSENFNHFGEIWELISSSLCVQLQHWLPPST